MRARFAVTLLIALLATTTAACGSSSSASPVAVTDEAVAARDAWIRAADEGGLSAAYLTISNGSEADDALVDVSAPDVATSVSLHETKTGDDGMTGMYHTPSIAVPAGGTVALEPGGYHVMLEGLQRDLVAGETVRIVLTFERAGPLTVDALVRAG